MNAWITVVVRRAVDSMVWGALLGFFCVCLPARTGHAGPADEPLSLALNGADVNLRYGTAVGRYYTIDKNTDLGQGAWTEIFPNIAGTNAVQNSVDSGAGTLPKCFYRLRSSVNMGMALIPAGNFSMGNTTNSTEGVPGELPVHTVYVSAFYMQTMEVTNDQMAAVMQWAWEHGKILANATTVKNLQGNAQELLDLDDSHCGIVWSGSSFTFKSPKGSGYPCVETTWYGAAAYCNYRSEMEGLTPCYDLSNWSCNFNANGYRLPTEAEWEKAARGGSSGNRFPWGDTITHSQANYNSSSSYTYDVSPTRGYHPNWDDGDSPHTSPGGTFGANGYGLYDMAGNLSEWCNDLFSGTYYGMSPSSNPTGPATGSSRVWRGGDWMSNAYYCRVSYRGGDSPAASNFGYGFRPVRR